MKIVVLTNSSGIYGLEPSLNELLKGFAEDGKDIASFDDVGKPTLIDLSKEASPQIAKSNVILISDQVEIPEELIGVAYELNELVGKDDLYIIYHDNPIVNYKVKHQKGLRKHFEKQIKSEVQSRQVLNSAHDKVFQVLANWKISDFNSLISIFPDPILEAKLELLHNCLHHESVPENLDSILKTFSADFDKFNKARQGKTLFDKEYMDALTELRKALLGS